MINKIKIEKFYNIMMGNANKQQLNRSELFWRIKTTII